jgi:DNA invertase Pin-like site-specific DNA recombinase
MNADSLPICAAQYLRMSTEHQQYSFDNQRAAIGDYASKAGFVVTKTYSDAGKSGLVLKHRDGLRQLLNDVVGGRAEYKAILVYDVSRLGRFQDVDEAAHYEFICKAAGVRIHYCAEQFSNDGSLPNSMMKALKRVMAGEYSRELSTKVHEGSKRVSIAGFRTGGMAGYGLRRLLVSADREAKCILLRRERKALQSDHVILVPGPDDEVRWVREIYRLFTEAKWLPSAIAAKLRKEGVAYTGFKRKAWYGGAIRRLLKNPKYCGCSVFGQSTSRLHTKRIVNPPNSWTITTGAWQPLVDPTIFEQAKKRFENLRNYRTDAELLSGLRSLLEKKGTLSLELVNRARDLPSVRPFVSRFGSLSEAFEKVGFVGERSGPTRTRRTIRALRDRLVAEIVAAYPGDITLIQPDAHFRPRLRLFDQLVSVFVCRCMPKDDQASWLLVPVARESSCVALIALLDPGNERVTDLYVAPDTEGQVRYQFTADDPWLQRGQRTSIVDFISAVRVVSSRSAQQTSDSYLDQ